MALIQKLIIFISTPLTSFSIVTSSVTLHGRHGASLVVSLRRNPFYLVIGIGIILWAAMIGSPDKALGSPLPKWAAPLISNTSLEKKTDPGQSIDAINLFREKVNAYLDDEHRLYLDERNFKNNIYYLGSQILKKIPSERTSLILRVSNSLRKRLNKSENLNLREISAVIKANSDLEAPSRQLIFNGTCQGISDLSDLSPHFLDQVTAIFNIRTFAMIYQKNSYSALNRWNQIVKLKLLSLNCPMNLTFTKTIISSLDQDLFLYQKYFKKIQSLKKDEQEIAAESQNLLKSLSQLSERELLRKSVLNEYLLMGARWFNKSQASLSPGHLKDLTLLTAKIVKFEDFKFADLYALLNKNQIRWRNEDLITKSLIQIAPLNEEVSILKKIGTLKKISWDYQPKM